MGMFDHITCEAPLPVEGFQDHQFQTKCLQEWPSLAHYEIRSDMRLVLVAHGVPTRSACGNIVDFTGTCNFYTFADNSRQQGWIEFTAVIRAGTVESISVHTHTNGHG